MSQTIINVNIFAEAESAGEFDDPSNYTLIMSADFVNDVYELNGSPSTLTALFDGTDPSGFDSEGMSTYFGGSNWPVGSAALLSALWAGMDNGLTVVYEIDYNGFVDDLQPAFFLSDNADIDLATNYIEWWAGGGHGYGQDQEAWFPDPPETWDEGFTAVDGYNGRDIKGVVRTGLVLSRSNGTDYEYEISYNGAFTASLGTTTYNQKTQLSTLSAFHVFNYQPWGFGHNLTTTRIRSIKIYEAMSSQALLRASSEGIPFVCVINPTIDGKKDFTFPSFKAYAAGGKPPYNFSIESGTLPAGLNFDETTGLVSGTPTALGTSSGIVIRGADSDGNHVDSDPFSITIRERVINLIARFTTSTQTNSSISFGEEHTDRWIIVITAFGTINSMTIGGVTARSVAPESSTKFWYAKVPTGTSGDIVLGAAPGSQVYYRVFAYYGPGLVVHDSKASATSATPSISNIKQRNDGFFLGAVRHGVFDNPFLTWTGLNAVNLPSHYSNTVLQTAIKHTGTDSGSSDVSVSTDPSTNSVLNVVSFMETGPELIGASTISYLTSGTTRTTTVPSDVQENDLMLVVVMHRSALTSIPSGWTLVASEDTNALGVTQWCSVYKKNAGASDAGTNITWTQTSAGRMAAQLLAWRSAAGTLSVLNSAQSSQDVDTTDSNIHTFPEVTGTADDQVFFIAATSVISNGSSVVTTVSVPEEYFLASTASIVENRMEVAWRLGDNAEVSSGQFTTNVSGTSENGIAKVAVLIGL